MLRSESPYYCCLLAVCAASKTQCSVELKVTVMGLQVVWHNSIFLPNFWVELATKHPESDWVRLASINQKFYSINWCWLLYVLHQKRSATSVEVSLVVKSNLEFQIQGAAKFNLYPEKWFEGSPVKSTQFLNGCWLNLLGWHLVLSCHPNLCRCYPKRSQVAPYKNLSRF